MEIKEFDNVLLKDGRTGAIMGGAPDGTYYYVDVGYDIDTWDNITVSRDQIVRVLESWEGDKAVETAAKKAIVEAAN